MRSHGAQTHDHVPGKSSASTVAPASDRIIVYSIIRLNMIDTTLQVAGLGAVPDVDFTISFDAADLPGQMKFGEQGILFSEGCEITTGSAVADFKVVYEKVDKIVA